MWKRLKPPIVDIEEYHAKICMTLILAYTNSKKEDKKLSEYNLQEFRNYIQKKIISI